MKLPALEGQSGVYAITNVMRTPPRKYIGSSSKLHARFREHISHLRRGKHRNRLLQAAFEKYGNDAFTVEVLEYCPVEQLIARERVHIDQAGTLNSQVGYNLKIPTEHGRKPTGRKGMPLSQEQKAKISASLRGRKLSPDHVAKIAAANMGRPSPQRGSSRSPEVCQRISESHKGRVKSAEHCRNISKGQKGKPKPRPPMTEERKAELREARRVKIEAGQASPRTLSPFQKQKMQEGRMKSPNRARPKTPEMIAKMVANRKPMTEEHKAKLKEASRNAPKRPPLSVEHLAKMAEGRRAAKRERQRLDAI